MIRTSIFLLFPALLFGQTIIKEHSYVIDSTHNLIVVNHDVNEINAASTGPISSLTFGDEIYPLLSPVSQFENGNAYNLEVDNTTYTLYFSTLPIIKMTTTGEISDSPKILGDFTFKAPGSKVITSMIGVEYRGASSQAYPKKSMEIEFWLDEKGDETEELSLLNLNKSDAFNLQAMYNEKLRINSKTSNDLWQKMHPNVHYKDIESDAKSGVIMRYADLFLNGKYHGVYAIGEKVNRKFLKLEKLENSLIKGELYKADNWSGATLFSAVNPFDNNLDVWDGYEYKHPKDLIRWDNLHNLVDFVVNENTETFNNTYSTKFDVDNIVDYFIFLNLLRATDNRGKNTYLAKYNNDSPYFYVPWDLDGTFGSIYNGSEQDVVDDLLFNGLYARLWEDRNFRQKLADRWYELRTDIITKDHLVSMLEGNIKKLNNNGVYDREALVWKDYEFPEDLINYQSNWIKRRIDYLDSIMKTLNTTEATIKKSSLTIYPNPSSQFIYINEGNVRNAQIKIIDVSGREIKTKNLGNITKEVQISVSNIQEGIYFVILKGDEFVKTARLIIKK